MFVIYVLPFVKKWHSLVRDTFLEEVNAVYDSELNWFDHESLEAVKSKINSLKISLPRPFNRSDVDFFQALSLKDNYLSSSMDLIKRRQNLIYSMYRIRCDSPYALWLLFSKSYADESNYIYKINTLVIPEVILLKHNKKLPATVLIGRLGYTIAKAFTQAVDILGIEIDHTNKFNRILTSESFKTFEAALQHFDAGAFDFTQSHTEDGKSYQFLVTTSLTLNDRFSDISATKLALETLRRQGNNSQVLLWGGFSREQLYYITLAQTFCTKKKVSDFFPTLFEQKSLPSFLRIRTMFSNIEEFHSSFSCAFGMPMRMDKDLMLHSFPYLQYNFDYEGIQ